jgi:hypothetical protein
VQCPSESDFERAENVLSDEEIFEQPKKSMETVFY